MRQFTLRLRKILLCDLLYYLTLFIVVVFLFFYHHNFIIKDEYNINKTEFKLKILNYKINEDKLSITFNNIIGKYYFKDEDEINYFINNYSINDYVLVNGTLSMPSNNSIPNTFNYKDYLFHRNIKYILKIDNFKIVKKNKNIFYKIKNYIYKRINNINNNEYLYAFILGDSSHIDTESYSSYKTNSITHLFALSGLHISIFSSLIMIILKKLKSSELSSFIITSLFLTFFSFIASFTPSILRALVFFILSNINKIYYFYIKPKNLLFLTFSILILINPHFIFYTGFILSFTITFFILLYNENSTKTSILKISIVSFFSSLPIIINTNYEINILGFINNIFFIPFVSSIVFPTSLITLLIPKLSFILKILTNIMEVVSSFSSKILNITLYIQRLNILEIILYYLFLILVIKKIKKTKLFLILLMIIIYLKPYFFKDTTIYYLDVNQGDSTLIVDKKYNYLIDTGGNQSDLMIDTLIPFFKSIGLKKIDYLILTHGDYDHMGFSKDLINNFKVEKVIFNCGEYNELESDLIDTLDYRKIEYDSCINNLNDLEFLKTKNYSNENDNSNVIIMELDGYKFMFMGDASITTEKDILDKYNLPDIDVLKVGHHGSKTSSGQEFINEINPKYSIISVGKNNRYGHPNKEVLNALDNSKIYRTDQDGSIMFKIRNSKLRIETCCKE